MSKVLMNGQSIDVDGDQPLVKSLLNNKVNVKMVCGGNGLCATCHIYVQAGEHALSAPTEREKMTLSVLTGAQANSRLACQCKVIDSDLEITLPEGLYVESFDEIDNMVGKRTKVPILHPRTGQILVEANKIIIRTQIRKLEDMDFSEKSLEI